MVICRGHGMPEGLPRSEEPHEAMGTWGKTEQPAEWGDRWAQADLTRGSLENSAASNLNPRSHSIPHASPTALCLKHSSEHELPCSHPTEVPAPRPGTPGWRELVPGPVRLGVISQSFHHTPQPPQTTWTLLECPPPSCLGNSNSTSSVRSSLISPLLIRRGRQSLWCSPTAVCLPSFLRDSSAGYKTICSHRVLEICTCPLPPTVADEKFEDSLLIVPRRYWF